LLATLFNVSAVRLAEAPPTGIGIAYDSQDIPGLVVAVVPAQALGWRKCDRCWTWSAGVGADARHSALCDRCLPVVLARS